LKIHRLSPCGFFVWKKFNTFFSENENDFPDNKYEAREYVIPFKKGCVIKYSRINNSKNYMHYNSKGGA